MWIYIETFENCRFSRIITELSKRSPIKKWCYKNQIVNIYTLRKSTKQMKRVKQIQIRDIYKFIYKKMNHTWFLQFYWKLWHAHRGISATKSHFDVICLKKKKIQFLSAVIFLTHTKNDPIKSISLCQVFVLLYFPFV